MTFRLSLLTGLLSILYHNSLFSEPAFPESYISNLINQFETEQLVSVIGIPPGSIKKVQYGEFTVYIYKRTTEDIDYLEKHSNPMIYNDDERRWKEVTASFRLSTFSRIPNYLIRESQKKVTGLPFRSLKNNIFVVIATSPRYGCNVKYLHPKERINKFDIFMNVCHGQRYDSAGREITDTGTPDAKGYNLFIPPYTYINNDIVIGGFKINQKMALSPINYNGLSSQRKLWLACNNNDYSAVTEALADGADPNLKDKNANALDYAITGSDLRTIKLLIKYGAQPTDISREMANIAKREEVLPLLKALGNK